MKKILKRDKICRKKLKQFEKKKTILKTIFKNFHFNNLTRLNSLNSITKISRKSSKVFINNICVYTISKKKLNKMAYFSRIIFRKFAIKNFFSGIHKLAR